MERITDRMTEKEFDAVLERLGKTREQFSLLLGFEKDWARKALRGKRGIANATAFAVRVLDANPALLSLLSVDSPKPASAAAVRGLLALIHRNGRGVVDWAKLRNEVPAFQDPKVLESFRSDGYVEPSKDGTLRITTYAEVHFSLGAALAFWDEQKLTDPATGRFWSTTEPPMISEPALKSAKATLDRRRAETEPVTAANAPAEATNSAAT